MKKIFTIALACLSLFVLSCNKAPQTTPDTFPVLEQDVLDDFTNYVAIDQYLDLKTAAFILNDAVQNLYANATEANITLQNYK